MPNRQPWIIGSPVRQARLASGLILFLYIATHLLNHAVLNFSLPAADAVLLLQKFIWQGTLGTALLYSALFIHMLLGLWSLYIRRTAGWRRGEALQLALGLAIPAMLANHITVTRLAWSLQGLDKGYIAELYALWVAEPPWGYLQMAVLVVAWFHGCLGLYFLLRLRRAWPSLQAPLLAAAILLPALALLGFLQGGREVARLLSDPAFRHVHLPVSVTGTAAQKAQLAWLRQDFLIGYAVSIILVLLARLARALKERSGRFIALRYPGDQRVRVPAGLTLLDASRRAGIPHASVCGGRGRCSTCRVRILWSAQTLPAPLPHEQRVLDGIGAQLGNIRLACQLCPGSDMAIVPLIPPAVASQYILGRTPRMPGDERFVVAMFIDLRGSTGLVERCMPFDSVFLLGRFITAATRAVTESGGLPVQFLGDGLLALFGLDTSPRIACQQALAAVQAASAEFATLSPLFGQETGGPLRYGIGVHCGRAIVGDIGFGDNVAFTALGDTIHLAHRLQELARNHEVAAAISNDVFDLAGVVAVMDELETCVRGRAQPIKVRLVKEREDVLF
jgi:adenylate cyclase